LVAALAKQKSRATEPSWSSSIILDRSLRGTTKFTRSIVWRTPDQVQWQTVNWLWTDGGIYKISDRPERRSEVADNQYTS